MDVRRFAPRVGVQSKIDRVGKAPPENTIDRTREGRRGGDDASDIPTEEMDPKWFRPEPRREWCDISPKGGHNGVDVDLSKDVALQISEDHEHLRAVACSRRNQTCMTGKEHEELKRADARPRHLDGSAQPRPKTLFGLPLKMLV